MNIYFTTDDDTESKFSESYHRYDTDHGHGNAVFSGSIKHHSNAYDTHTFYPVSSHAMYDKKIVSTNHDTHITYKQHNGESTSGYSLNAKFGSAQDNNTPNVNNEFERKTCVGEGAQFHVTGVNDTAYSCKNDQIQENKNMNKTKPGKYCSSYLFYTFIP